MLCAIREGAEEAGGRRGSARSRDEHAALAESVQRYIDAHYPKAITTSTIASALRYNPDYLERVFRARTNVSILDALHQKRISAARASLRGEPERNINEIARECGYTDPGYFRRMFKRLTGLTPLEFRTLYVRTHINTH